MPIGSPNAGYRTFNTGDVLTAAQVQFSLQNQSIMFFANAAARDAALGVGIVQEGMFAYLADTNTTVFFDGTSWIALSSGGDLTGITAGTGITVTNGSGPVPTVALSSNPTLTSPKETVEVVAAGSTGTINVDTLTASVEYYTGAATADWTLNVRGSGATTLNSTMAVNEQISVVYLNTNTATAYKPTGFTIDGSAVTPKWLGGAAPSSGTVNGIDAYVYTIIKTSAAPAYTVLASQNKFA
jgi:hypothetical protein